MLLNSWPVMFKSIKVIKVNETSLRHCARLTETNQTTQPNVTRDPEQSHCNRQRWNNGENVKGAQGLLDGSNESEFIF